MSFFDAKPCPTCKSVSIWLCHVDVGHLPFEPRFHVECKECSYCAPKAYTVRGAIKKWNRRAEK